MTSLIPVLGLTDYAIIAAIIAVTVAVTGRGAARIGSLRMDLRRLERKLDALLAHHDIELPSRLSGAVQRLARDPKQKIAAITLHREQTGTSLYDAKLEIEDFVAGNR